MLVLVALVLLSWLPQAEAGTGSAPELQDPGADVLVDDLGLPPSVGVPAPLQDAVDLRAVWFTDDAEGLHAHVQVASLAGLAMQSPGDPDFFWIAIWSPAYAIEDGAAARDGTWELESASPWHFWLERPCKDGDSFDGCTGPDRDILDGLPGSVDLEASTITITAPWRHMAGPAPGDGVHGLWATAQMSWPSYPAYSVDWDTDQGRTCYRFASLPFPASALEATDTGPTGGSNGRTALPETYDGAGCPDSAGSPVVPTDEDASGGTDTDAAPASAPAPGNAGGTVAPSTPTKRSPGPAAVAAVLATALATAIARRHVLR
jgi:hypothetical protein